MLFSPPLSQEKLNQMSPLVLAYVGDAVYELAVRCQLATGEKAKINELHQRTVSLVRAHAQAETMRLIGARLTEEEQAVVKRGRNAKSHSHPRHVVIGDYRLSTGLEALLGYLYLKGEVDRLKELLAWIIIDDEPGIKNGVENDES